MSPANKLRVVLTNDDGPPGPESPNIFGLYCHLTRDLGFDVKVLIPSTQKSWIGKSFQIKEVVTGRYYYPREPDGRNGETSDLPRPLKEGEVAEWILLDATPATCASIAIHNIYPGQVDLLISGPNYGRNTSAAFSLSSGTIGAALSSTLSGVRSIALSYGIFAKPVPITYEDPAHRLSGRIINHLLTNWGSPDILYSINIPMIESLMDEEQGMKIYWTSVWRNTYGPLFKKHELVGATDGETKTDEEVKGGSKLMFRFSPKFDRLLDPVDPPLGSDAWALAQGAASVTPLHPAFAEKDTSGEFPTVQDRVWKMKL